MKVREFADGIEIAQALVVRETEVLRRRDGGDYLKLTLSDRTGTVAAMVWDGVPEASDVCRAGEVVWVLGRFSQHPRFGPQLAVQQLRRAEPDEYVYDE